jgi:hypothetical protein
MMVLVVQHDVSLPSVCLEHCKARLYIYCMHAFLIANSSTVVVSPEQRLAFVGELSIPKA